MIFPNDRYETIDRLVLQYQKGDSKAAEELIQLFSPLFGKYAKIIKDGSIDFRDHDSRCFVSLFIADKDIRRQLKRRYQPRQAREAAYRMLSVIQSACRSLTDEDLQQEFIVILLTSATRYRVNKPFCSYFGMTFLYETAQVVKHLLRDPVTTSAQPLTDNIPYDALEDMLGPEELDENWVQGKTCSEIFSGLTSFDRLLLKMYYADNMRDHAISKKLGYHRNWIGHKRRMAIEYITKILRDNNLFRDG